MGLSLIGTKPGNASSADPQGNETYSPYRRHADIGLHRPIILRPPDSAEQQIDDPTLDAIDDIRTLIASQRRLIRLIAAPWLVMPPDGESFHKAAGITIPAIGANFSTVVTITCPSGRNGVLNRIANTFIGGGFNDFSGNIIWQILRNPVGSSPFPVSGVTTAERNYENIQASLGMTNNPAAIAPIRLFENDVIVLVVQNVSVVVSGQLIGGLLGGWFYPRAMDDLNLEPQTSVASW